MTEDDELYTIKLTRKELLTIEWMLSPSISPMADMEKLADKIIDALRPPEKHDV